MAKLNSIRLKWAGGTHWFLIEPPVSAAADDGAWIFKLAKGGKFPRAPAILHDRAGAILRRLSDGTFGHEDIIETVRCGLIGGCTYEALGRDGEHRAAFEAVTRYVSARPLMESLPLAQTILCATIYGVDEQVAKVGHPPESIPLSAFRDEGVTIDA